MTRIQRIREHIERQNPRSAWDKGVKMYALEIVEALEEKLAGGFITESDLSTTEKLNAAMLNGARDWAQFSEGGCALIYDGDIAARLCAPWELRKTKYGEKNPNGRETWIDVQRRALFQAARLVRWAAKYA